MRQRAIVLTLFAVLSVGLAACGSSGSSSSSSSTSTVPTTRLGASSAPPKLGYYAGIDCGSSSSGCDPYFTTSAEGYKSFCKGGKPNSGHSSDFQYKAKYYNYVCFTLQSSNQLVNFYYADAKIVNSVHVSSDRFPETCDNGYCISGEWFSTRDVNGRIRNPNHVYAYYKAVWIGS